MPRMIVALRRFYPAFRCHVPPRRLLKVKTMMKRDQGAVAGGENRNSHSSPVSCLSLSPQTFILISFFIKLLISLKQPFAKLMFA
jgi:hypothetical protein